jgi:hypothetical protein
MAKKIEDVYHKKLLRVPGGSWQIPQIFLTAKRKEHEELKTM